MILSLRSNHPLQAPAMRMHSQKFDVVMGIFTNKKPFKPNKIEHKQLLY
jgi:tRNA (Thr-GGU) A37 N-methylase